MVSFPSPPLSLAQLLVLVTPLHTLPRSFSECCSFWCTRASSPCVIDEVALHLIVLIKDAFRIGRRKPNPDESSRPRPLLTKLNNYWHRRLLLTAHFTLKSFEKYKLYLHEDLPPQSSNRKSPNSPRHDSLEKVALSDPISVPTDRDSTCDVMDGSTKLILLHSIA